MCQSTSFLLYLRTLGSAAGTLGSAAFDTCGQERSQSSLRAQPEVASLSPVSIHPSVCPAEPHKPANPISTPSRPSKASSGSSGPTSQMSQNSLKTEMMHDLTGHILQFPIDRFVRMVSPRTRKENAMPAPGPSDILDRPEFYSIPLDDANLVEAASSKLEETFDWRRLEVNGIESIQHYTALANFLNACLTAVREVQQDDGSFYKNLRFLVYDQETGDGVAGASPLKPDVVGLNGTCPTHDAATLKIHEKLSWSVPPSDTPIDIPVEVKGRWSQLVYQAATYARCMFSAEPLRNSALVFGFNQDTLEFRFLLFHRGGLSASTALDLHKREGRAGVVRVLAALLRCHHRRELGFQEWCNEASIQLPLRNTPSQKTVDLTVVQVLHASFCCRGRATRVYRALLPQTSPPLAPPEIPQRLIPNTTTRRSLRTSNSNSNSRPPPSITKPRGTNPRPVTDVQPQVGCHKLGIIGWGEMKKFSLVLDGLGRDIVIKTAWACDDREWSSLEAELLNECSNLFGCPRHLYSFTPSSEDGVPVTNHFFLPMPEEDLSSFTWPSFPAPTRPEYRSLVLHVSGSIGESLVRSESPYDLFTSIFHAILGWLAMFERGFAHRDVSIGNVLRLARALQMDPYKINNTLWTDSPALDAHVQMLGQSWLDYTQSTKTLQDVLRTLAVGSHAKGVIIDGDMAARWHDFGAPRNKTRSGTPEFMSLDLLSSVETQDPYLHSPVDDMYSMFFVTQWAAAGHPTNRNLPKVQKLCEDLGGSQRQRATDMIRDLGHKVFRADYGNFLPPSSVLLKAWWDKLGALRSDFKISRLLISQANGTREETKRLLHTLFLASAYRAVSEFAQEFASWTTKYGPNGSESHDWKD
uniref:Fungal-type protein kinase domain-containing protein n=1 Tax=Mycena chlorophos TaxID=658473 RepID=A0ABQ0M320_MYCCL|nr:predicted protein [Mycena chlorophos]